MTTTEQRPPGAVDPVPGTVVGRVYAASLLVNLPVLAVQLLPQMRSRVSSETTMAICVTALFALVVAAVVVAPEVSARVAPGGERWRFGDARRRVRALIRQDRGGYARRFGELVALYVAAQCVGGIIAWITPHVRENPDFATDPTADRWLFDYPAFAAQAVGIYLVICLATSWYSCRLRQLALVTPEAGRSAGRRAH
ncbi:hypothetical protein [Streptomyces sp. NBRC 109706]|uniref:hypothetical protein n=1 Tax=Streptomyces sp. NBRC 109706 TaxID=1550035 RepID=UPI000783E768|nr:hypothetical protein [Streptomyces sp. NBRC 109706]